MTTISATVPPATTIGAPAPPAPPTRFLPGDQVEDAALLARVAVGDDDAFALLYDRHARRVFGIALRVIRDPARAEEVAQEVFTEAWRLAPRYDPSRGSVPAWLATISHRRAVDRVRSDQAARLRDASKAVRDRERPHDPVQEAVLTDSEHREVRGALAELTDVQRQAIELAYYGGHTYREVAELLGAPLGTVKTRIRDGLHHLRETLLAIADGHAAPGSPATSESPLAS